MVEMPNFHWGTGFIAGQGMKVLHVRGMHADVFFLVRFKMLVHSTSLIEQSTSNQDA